jgi:hypothetical protein
LRPRQDQRRFGRRSLRRAEAGERVKVAEVKRLKRAARASTPAQVDEAQADEAIRHAGEPPGVTTLQVRPDETGALSVGPWPTEAERAGPAPEEPDRRAPLDRECDEILELRAEVERLRAENEELEAKNRRLAAQRDELLATLHELQDKAAPAHQPAVKATVEGEPAPARPGVTKTVRLDARWWLKRNNISRYPGREDEAPWVLQRFGETDKGEVVQTFTVGLETADESAAVAKARAMIASGEAEEQCRARSAERIARAERKASA